MVSSQSKEDLARYLQAASVLRTRRIIDAFMAIDRKDFLRPEDEDDAYRDEPISIGEGQTISQPYTVAFMLELLNPQKGHVVLDAGAGSGWQTALLAYIVAGSAGGGKVYAFEGIAALSEFGRTNISKYTFIEKKAVFWQCGNASHPPEDVKFDRIIAGASIHCGEKNKLQCIPPAWIKQLRDGGIIVVPLGSSLWRFIKRSEGDFEYESYPGFLFVPFYGNRTDGI
ncbi:MAG: protein-L-isoaspartate O-methyltransferase [Candidatus Niyogibacteria bacterium]|nr:protein-L-isoaspartate O-methyltransferase [Candidatus Niyogibacteria bacterium]